MKPSLRVSVLSALKGVRHVLSTQRNARIHTIIGLFVMGLGLLLGLTRVEMSIVLLVIALVIVTEIINTALEIFADAVHPRVGTQVERFKDASAASVLIASLIALLIGALIFIPHLLG